jgi:hypothetical protein
LEPERVLELEAVVQARQQEPEERAGPTVEEVPTVALPERKVLRALVFYPRICAVSQPARREVLEAQAPPLFQRESFLVWTSFRREWRMYIQKAISQTKGAKEPGYESEFDAQPPPSCSGGYKCRP